MLIEAHIIAFNESDIIRLTANHYKKFCDRILIYDNYSTDGTADIARELGCEVTQFGRRGELDDDAYLQVKNEMWKTTRADFLVVGDCDEILYHPNLRELVEEAKREDYTVFRTEGFDMYADKLPLNDWLDVKEGIPDGSYSKTMLFSPKVRHINYQPGAHVCDPHRAIYSPHVLKVLHMRNAGGLQRVIDRHAMYRPRMSKRNLARKRGIHYNFTDEYRTFEYNEKSKNKRPVI